MTCPTDAELLAFIDGTLSAELRDRAESHFDTCPSCLSIVAALAQSADAAPPSAPAPGPLLADGEPRYTLGAEIARGGMGRIHAAEDRLLGRRVALKRMRHGGERLLQRFRREQRITARLQHPAIVPIYDAGTLPGGEPFFAMRLVTGESLDRTIASARALADRLRLLPAVLGVVDAVAYAHGEGVVHRDLKPQNVLVGPFGEVVVVDWGLARELGAEPERGDEGTGGGEPLAAPPDATRDGDVLGTLAYMAPEQAAGRPADARSDVYGLGAILYHVLAGVPPHAAASGSGEGDLLRGAPLPLARRVPDAPLDLLAIVERAMAVDPEARYPSAEQLAGDLKRWQAGRLVEAHRYTPGELARRFGRRHRAPLLVLLASLLVLLTLGGVALRRIVAERGHALAEQARAETARTRAEAQRVAAETLVSFLLGDLRGRLERVGRLDALEGVAAAVIAYHDGTPASEDAATLLRRSEVAGLAGDVAFTIGDLGAADASYRRSRAAAEEAGAAEGAVLARCHAALRLGDVRKRRGELGEATALYTQGAELARGLPGRRAAELALQSRLALAEVARIRGDLPGSERLLEEGRATAASLAEEPDGSRLLVQLHNDLWKTLNLAGKVSEERAEAAAGLAFARARAAQRPDDFGARYDLAMAQTAVGAAEEHGGALAAAEQAYRRALEEHRLLASRDPSNTEWQRAVGVVADRLGSLEMTRGDPKAALPWLKESDEASLRLAAIAPDNLEWQRDVGVSATALGDALAQLGRVDEARAVTERAVTVLDRLVGKAGDAGRSEHDLGVALGHLGQLELGAHRIAAGQAAQQRSIALLRRHLGGADTPQTRQELAAALMILAESESGAAARGHIEEALRVLEPVRALASASPELRELLKEADELGKK